MAGSRTLMMVLLAVFITAGSTLEMKKLRACKDANVKVNHFFPTDVQNYFNAEFEFTTESPNTIFTIQYPRDMATLTFLGLIEGFLQMIVFCKDGSSVTARPPGGALSDGKTHTVTYNTDAINGSRFVVDGVVSDDSVGWLSCSTHPTDSGRGSNKTYDDIMEAIAKYPKASGCATKAFLTVRSRK